MTHFVVAINWEEELKVMLAAAKELPISVYGIQTEVATDLFMVKSFLDDQDAISSFCIPGGDKDLVENGTSTHLYEQPCNNRRSLQEVYYQQFAVTLQW